MCFQDLRLLVASELSWTLYMPKACKTSSTQCFRFVGISWCVMQASVGTSVTARHLQALSMAQTILDQVGHKSTVHKFVSTCFNEYVIAGA